MTIGERLRRAREERGWSTRRLEMETMRLGRKVSHGFISQIENGDRYGANPSLATLEVLAKALSKPLAYLLAGDPDPGESQAAAHGHPSVVVHRVQSLLQQRGSNIERLAREIGESEDHILSLTDDNPDLAVVQRLALALNTTMHYLLGRSDDPSPLPGIAVAHHDPSKGVQPGDPMPPETQLIVERAIIAAKKEWGWGDH